MDHSFIKFSEFTSIIGKDLLDGIVKSSLEQEKTILGIEKAAYSDLGDFRRKYISDTEIRQELEHLFPKKVDEETVAKTLVDSKEVYIPESENHREYPEILLKIGYKMKAKEDYYKVKNSNVYKITTLGYQRITEVIGIKLAKKEQEVLQKLISNGFPRVLMSSGRVNSKVVFSLDNAQHTTGLALKRGLRVKTLGTENYPFFLMNLKTNMISEVEINFKSIMP